MRRSVTLSPFQTTPSGEVRSRICPQSTSTSSSSEPACASCPYGRSGPSRGPKPTPERSTISVYPLTLPFSIVRDLRTMRAGMATSAAIFCDKGGGNGDSGYDGGKSSFMAVGNTAPASDDDTPTADALSPIPLSPPLRCTYHPPLRILCVATTGGCLRRGSLEPATRRDPTARPAAGIQPHTS